MSSFICKHCGAEIVEGENGYYVSACEHYPFDPRPAAKSLAEWIDEQLHNRIHGEYPRYGINSVMCGETK